VGGSLRRTKRGGPFTLGGIVEGAANEDCGLATLSARVAMSPSPAVTEPADQPAAQQEGGEAAESKQQANAIAGGLRGALGALMFRYVAAASSMGSPHSLNIGAHGACVQQAPCYPVTWVCFCCWYPVTWARSVFSGQNPKSRSVPKRAAVPGGIGCRCGCTMAWHSRSAPAMPPPQHTHAEPASPRQRTH
jgi:hypothetical protein